VLIFILSSISNVPTLPGHMSDKTAHTLLYAGLGFLVARALAKGLGRPVPGWIVLVVAAFSGLYGLSDETHQLFVPHRSFELMDMVADVAGGTLGAGVLWAWSIIAGSRHGI
jgi:VanZ family protein